MRSITLRLALLALFCVPFVGCGEGGGGGIEAGIPADATSGPPPAMPGMDEMKAKMEKK